MKKLFVSETQKQASIVTGFAIVVMAIAAVVANDITIRNLIVENNTTETLNNILASKTKFNIGVLGWLVVLIFDLVTAWGLYIFFKTINKNLSLLTAWFRLVYVAMLAVSILNLMHVHIFINHMELSSADLTGDIGKSIIFYLDAFDAMWAISLIAFGIHILLVGYLALKSDYIPNIFGILLMVAFIGYTIPKISNLIFPQYKDIMRNIEIIFFIPMLSEVALGIWLLIIGFKRGYLK